MRLAEPDSGVNVERIEHHRLAATGIGDLFGRRMSKRVGTADHEQVEAEARIERRAPERLLLGCGRHHEVAVIRGLHRILAVARRFTALRFRLGAIVAQHRGANADLDPAHQRLLRSPAGQHPLGVMRLNPALQEPCRDREPDHVVVEAIEIHAREPAGEDVVAHLGPQPLLDPRPSLQIRARHLGGLSRGLRRGRQGSRQWKNRRCRLGRLQHSCAPQILGRLDEVDRIAMEAGETNAGGRAQRPGGAVALDATTPRRGASSRNRTRNLGARDLRGNALTLFRESERVGSTDPGHVVLMMPPDHRGCNTAVSSVFFRFLSFSKTASRHYA